MSRTLDTPVPGVVVAQPRRGFRYGAESFWLAGFALEGGAPSHALDLGTGSGVVALLLAAHGVGVVGVDRTEEWSPLWHETMARSTLAGSVELRIADVLDDLGPKVPLVVSNPPFFAPEAGKASPDAWKRAARTEGTARIPDFARRAVEQSTGDGRACLVVPLGRETDVRARGAYVARRLQVGDRRVLVELRLGAEESRDEGKVEEDDPRVLGWYSGLRSISGSPCPE